MKTMIIAALVCLLAPSAFAKTAKCGVVEHENGAGWTAVIQNGTLLSQYAPDADDTLNRLAELKDMGLCRNSPLSCEIVTHSNGAGYTALKAGKAYISNFVASRAETEGKLRRLKEQGICQSTRTSSRGSGQKCTIVMHENGAGWSAVATLSGTLLSEYNPSIDATIARWTELKDDGICNDYSFQCEVRYHENGAGWSAVFADGKIPLTSFDPSIRSTTEKFAQFKDADVCR